MERSILVGMESSEEHAEDMLEELQGLAETAGALILDTIIQKRSKPHPATFFGRGKVEEIGQRCKELDATLLICDQELTPAQLRNLEELLEMRVVDRSQLILDIFAQRAQTKEGKLQVELAQLNYLLPRLTGRGTEMSRLGGGIGTRGPGETKLEVDRRRIRQRIADLRKDLNEVMKHRQLHRKKRRAVPLPLVSIVGYTNAGKSTLLNVLAGADVLAEDKLFATLDPTTRRVVLPTNEAILLTDTVGFIQKLPHHLVAAFSATLEEVIEADLLLHVVDTSHPRFEQQINTVEKVLKSLGAGDKQAILVLNKIDKAEESIISRDIKDNYYGEPVRISAKNHLGLDGLLDAISKALASRRLVANFFIPFERSDLTSILHQKGRVLSQEYMEQGVEIHVEIEEIWARRVWAKLKKS